MDVTIAIELFDYLADPLPVLRRMQEVSRDRAIISFRCGHGVPRCEECASGPKAMTFTSIDGLV